MKTFNLLRIVIVVVAGVLVIADYTFSVSRYPDSSIIGFGLLSALFASITLNPINKLTKLWYVRWVLCPALALVFLLLALASSGRA